MKTILLFLYHFSHMSDVLQTDWIKEMAKDCRVVVVTPKRSGEIPMRHFSSPNVVYETYQIKNLKLFHRFKLLRVSTVRKFDHLTIMQYSYKLFFGDSRRKFLRILSYPFARLLNPNFYTFLETKFLSASPSFDNLVKKYSPSLVATATPGLTALEAEVIILAKQKGIPTVALNFSWDNLTSNALHMRKPDYLICWNETMEEEAIRLHGYDASHVFVAGIPRFDYYFIDDQKKSSREEFLANKGLDPSQKTVFITTVPKTTFPYQKDVISHIVSLKEKRKLGMDFNIFIRVHPIDMIDLYKEFEGRAGIHIERAGHARLPDAAHGHKVEMTKEDLLNLKDSYRFSDVNVNFASTITLEACIFDLPVLNVGVGVYNEAYEWTHYKPLVDMGAVRVAQRLEDIQTELQYAFNNHERDAGARKDAVRRFVGFSDGNSARRNAQFVKHILNLRA